LNIVEDFPTSRVKWIISNYKMNDVISKYGKKEFDAINLIAKKINKSKIEPYLIEKFILLSEQEQSYIMKLINEVK